jgi:hypothetical protein
MLWYSFPIKGPTCSAKDSHKSPSCTMWLRDFTKYITKYEANPHSMEQVIDPIVLLISKQDIPYWIRGGTCCLGGLLLRFRP